MARDRHPYGRHRDGAAYRTLRCLSGDRFERVPASTTPQPSSQRRACAAAPSPSSRGELGRASSALPSPPRQRSHASQLPQRRPGSAAGPRLPRLQVLAHETSRSGWRSEVTDLDGDTSLADRVTVSERFSRHPVRRCRASGLFCIQRRPAGDDWLQRRRPGCLTAFVYTDTQRDERCAPAAWELLGRRTPPLRDQASRGVRRSRRDVPARVMKRVARPGRRRQ